MRKVIKIFGSVISAVILTAIILPVTVWLLLFLPPVQHFVVKQASEYASELLGTVVSFERVNIRLFNAVDFRGLYLEDYRQDTLLYVGRLSAGVDPGALFRREIVLRDVRLADGAIHVKKYDDNTTNVWQVLQKFRSEEPADVKLLAAALGMRNMEFTYTTDWPQPGMRQVNFEDMAFSGIDLSARDLSVIGDSISVRLNNLSFTEKSGLTVTELSAERINVSNKGVRVTGSRLATPDSDVYIDHVYLDKIGDRGFVDLMNDVFVDAEIRNSTFGLRTLGYFTPGPWDYGITFRNLNTSITGRPSDISGWLTSGVLDSTRVSMLFAVRGLPSVGTAEFSVTLDSLVTTGYDTQNLIAGLAGIPVSDSVQRQVGGLGAVSLKGNFTGRPDNFTANAELRTAQGNGHADLAFRPSERHENATAFSGAMNLENIELGALIGASEIGRLSLAADVSGFYGGGHLNAATNTELSQLEYNGYRYHSVRLNGSVYDRQFVGLIASRDPNLHFDFDGLLDFNDTIPRYDFEMKLRNADLRRLNFNRRDSVSRVAFDARVAGSGGPVDDLNGEARIRNLLYVNQLDTVRTGDIVITGRNNPEGKYLAFNSDFADASFRSRMSYAQLGESLQNAFYNYLPSLSEYMRVVHPFPDAAGSIENYSVVDIEVKEANNVAGIFVPGLVLAKGSKVTVTFNPDNERFSLTANSDYVELGDSFVSKLEVNSRNVSDSLSLFVRAEELYTAGFLVPNLSVISGARENRINTSIRFANETAGQSALLGTAIALGRDPESGLPQATINFTPSYYSIGDQRWNIFARGITATRERVQVRDFGIEGDGQLLHVTGTASAGARDTLRVNVRNFDINPLSSLLNVGYQFHGRASGEGYLLSTLKSPILNARIELDSMYVDHVKTPPVTFLSSWDYDTSRMRFMLLEQPGDRPIVSATYLPSARRVDGTVKIEGIDLSLLDVHYEGTLHKTAGRADLDATIGGIGRQIKLNGAIQLHEYNAYVDFLNVGYSVADTGLRITDNVIHAEGITARDPEGNPVGMDMSVDLNKLNNAVYSFTFRPENALVLNTTEADNDQFYGKVYATGNGTIRGSKRGVNMDITASTGDGSRFYMPLNDKSDMSDADFVRFVQSRNRPVADTTEYNRRKRMIMSPERRNRRIEATGNINTDIALTVLPNTLVELLIDPQSGHTVRGRGNGSLNLHVNPRNDEFTMYGDYRISEGVYLFTLENIIEKPFAIEQGSDIQWTGDPVDPLMNIAAVYRLKTSIGAAVSNTGFSNWKMRIPVECRIMLTERMSQPSLNFNITAPGATPEVQNILAGFLNTQEMMATQFFFLLATSNFYDYEGNTGGNIGAAAGSATAFDFLSNQFSNWISSDRFNIGIRYRPQTDITSDEWGVDLSQQLLGDRLLLEIEGNYDTRNNSDAVYSENMKNFTGDFYLTALLNRAGNLKAKLFSRTITRFDENQGLQEWGAGLYYSEDFNTFGDVLKNIKERFTGERRRRKLLLLQMEQEAEEGEEEINSEE